MATYPDIMVLDMINDKVIVSKDGNIRSLVQGVNKNRKTAKMGSGKWLSLKQLFEDYRVEECMFK